MHYLGVDGGGTTTAFLLINDKGSILSHKVKATCHYVQVGMDGLQNTLSEGIVEALNEASMGLSDVNHVFLGLPGYGEQLEDISRIEEAVGNVIQYVPFTCGNDVEAGWAGSLACQPGINIVGGTGSIGYGKDQFGNGARAGGWGYYCGDEGSGYWLGKKVISLFAKEADGREEKTALYEIVRNQFELARDFDLITVVYEDLEMRRDRVAELALLLHEAAKQGDPKALEIYAEAAYEFSLVVKALIRRLDFKKDEPIAVSYSGGVFKAGDYILRPLEDLICQERVRLVEPVLEPVAGAALYAMVLSGQRADQAVVENLKAEWERVCN
jgi:N-acetylglucosamine kinase-like BadF-type ATPase